MRLILTLIAALITFLSIDCVRAQPIGEWDPFSIHLNGDNDSSISANINFPLGISIDTPVYPSQAIKITVPEPSLGSDTAYYGGMEIFREGDGSAYGSIGLIRADILGPYEDFRLLAYNKTNQNGLGVGIYGADALTSGYSGGGIYLQAGLGVGTGNGADIGLKAGDHFSAGGGVGGNIILTPGYDYASGAHGVVKIYDSNTGTYWTLVDNSGNAFTQSLTTSGTTTIQSFTGIAKLTSGVVGTASGSDLLTAIGTIDISSNTNLAVSSPITLSGDTVGFDQTANFSWSGTHSFTNTSGITLSSTSPIITFTDTSASEDDYSLATLTGTFTLTNTTDSRVILSSTGAGTNTFGSATSGATNVFNVATGNTHIFQVNSAEELRIAANRLTTNNGSSDTYLDWTTDGQLTIGGGIFRATGTAIIQASAFTPYTSGYELSLQSSGTYAYLEILNDTGAGLGAFFGLNSNTFELYNYQGASSGSGNFPTVFYGGWGSAELARFDRTGGTVFNEGGEDIDFRIESDGDANNFFSDGGNNRIGIGTNSPSVKLDVVGEIVASSHISTASGSRFNFEGSGGDTYAYYDSGSSSLKFYVNGALAMELK